MITENLSTLKIHRLTQAQYERERDAGRLDENALYLTPDESFVTDETLSIAGKAADAKAVGDALANSGTKIYTQPEEPVDAEEGALWLDLDEEGIIEGIPGEPGKSAYQYALDGGYTGTEEDFSAKLAEETPKAFYVTVTQNGTKYTADKTITEIESAYQAGKPLYCYCTSPVDGMTYCLPLGARLYSGSVFCFGNASVEGVMTVIVQASSVRVTAGLIPAKTSQLTNDSGFLTEAPVTSVNGKTGAVQIDVPSIEGLATETYVNNQIAAIPAPTVDTTLTQEGIPADAKAVGEILGQLTEDIIGMIDERFAAITNAEEVAF